MSNVAPSTPRTGGSSPVYHPFGSPLREFVHNPGHNAPARALQPERNDQSDSLGVTPTVLFEGVDTLELSLNTQILANASQVNNQPVSTPGANNQQVFTASEVSNYRFLYNLFGKSPN